MASSPATTGHGLAMEARFTCGRNAMSREPTTMWSMARTRVRRLGSQLPKAVAVMIDSRSPPTRVASTRCGRPCRTCGGASRYAPLSLPNDSPTEGCSRCAISLSCQAQHLAEAAHASFIPPGLHRRNARLHPPVGSRRPNRRSLRRPLACSPLDCSCYRFRQRRLDNGLRPGQRRCPDRLPRGWLCRLDHHHQILLICLMKLTYGSRHSIAYIRLAETVTEVETVLAGEE